MRKKAVGLELLAWLKMDVNTFADGHDKHAKTAAISNESY